MSVIKVPQSLSGGIKASQTLISSQLQETEKQQILTFEKLKLTHLVIFLLSIFFFFALKHFFALNLKLLQLKYDYYKIVAKKNSVC